MDTVTVGMRIREARIRVGLSPKALAARAGLSHASVTSYERGDAAPSASAICGLADALGVTADYLLGRKGTEPDTILVGLPIILDTSPEAIGGRIAELRRWMGMSQQEMADRLGVARNTVARWERGESRPELDLLERLCAVSGKGLSYFYSGLDRVECIMQQEPWLRSLLEYVGKCDADGRPMKIEHFALLCIEAARGGYGYDHVDWALEHDVLLPERSSADDLPAVG